MKKLVMLRAPLLSNSGYGTHARQIFRWLETKNVEVVSDILNWGWAAVKAIEIPEEDREKHPILGKPGEFMKYRMDMKNMKMFKERDYIEALSHIEILPE